jgi:hypothetical protein
MACRSAAFFCQRNTCTLTLTLSYSKAGEGQKRKCFEPPDGDPVRVPSVNLGSWVGCQTFCAKGRPGVCTDQFKGRHSACLHLTVGRKRSEIFAHR